MRKNKGGRPRTGIHRFRMNFTLSMPAINMIKELKGIGYTQSGVVDKAIRRMYKELKQ